MISIGNEISCVECYACQTICTQSAIGFKKNKEGFSYPVIDEEKCVSCGACMQVCPVMDNCISKKQEELKQAWIAINESDSRENSSSGGVFPILAQFVIQKGGVVYGAAWDKLQVKHIGIEDKKQIQLLQSAKYQSSYIGDAYKDIKKHLQNNRMVLFSGTPCQVAGLKQYLGKEYDKLICVDLICHGMPSEIFFKKYIEWRKKQDKIDSPLMSINFRKKKPGWSRYQYSVEFCYENGAKTYIPAGEDLFMQGFTNDLCLRESCYQCKFKGDKRNSDITLGDFWGIWDLDSNFDDDKGTSVVVVNTIKGENVWKQVSEQLKVRAVDMKSAMLQNSSYYQSAKRPKKKSKFISKLMEDDFEKVVRESILLLQKEKDRDEAKKIFWRLVAKVRRVICK